MFTKTLALHQSKYTIHFVEHLFKFYRQNFLGNFFIWSRFQKEASKVQQKLDRDKTVRKKTVRIFSTKQSLLQGSGCGSVGRAVTSDTRDPWFESSHWQKKLFIY